MPTNGEHPACPNCGSAATVWLDYVIGCSFHCYCLSCRSEHFVLVPHFSRHEYDLSGANDWLWFVALALAMLCSFILYGK